jgi:hypothetical protein
MNDQGLDSRKFFIITFVDESPLSEINGERSERTISIPAYVKDMATAEEKALAYAADFANTPEGRQAKDAKLAIRSIVIGGTILI